MHDIETYNIYYGLYFFFDEMPFHILIPFFFFTKTFIFFTLISKNILYVGDGCPVSYKSPNTSSFNLI